MHLLKILKFAPVFLISAILLSGWWMSLAQANGVTFAQFSNIENQGSSLSANACVNSLTVTNTADSGVGSLRQVIEDVCDSGAVNFDLTYPATVTLTSNELLITKSLSLNGPGAENLTVNGDDSYRVFNIQSSITDVITLTGLTIANGHAITSGGGILFIGSGHLHVHDATIISNYSDENGGGMANYGQMIVANTVITNNYADEDGGGVYNLVQAILSDSTIAFNETATDGGGVYSSDQLTVTNTTINNNNADDDDGGGIYNSGVAILSKTSIVLNSVGDDGGGIYTTGQLTATNTTISANEEEGIYSSDGAQAYLMHVTITENDDEGIYLTNDSGILEIQNSLIVNNRVEDIDVSSSGDDTNIVSLGYNIIGSVFRVNLSTNTTGDLYGDNRNVTTPNPGATEVNGVIDGLLGSLMTDGDGSFSHVPQMWSPAINHIPNGQSGCGSTITTDQRDVSRPQFGACDVGAHEYNGSETLWVKKVVDDYNPNINQVLTYDIILQSIDLTASHTGVEINDTLPAELTPVGAVSVDGGTGASTGSHPSLVNSLTVAAGERVTATYQVRVENTTSLAGERLTNTVSIESEQMPTSLEAESILHIKPPDSDSDGIADFFDSAPSDPTLPESYAPQIYINYTDNENNAGTGSPDGDMVPNKVYAASSNHPIEFNIWIDQALPTRNALLSILSEDVDWPDEFNEVYLNGHKLQEMVGEDDLLNSTLFIIPDISWVNLGNNLVELEVNVTDDSTWSTKVFNGQIISDFGEESIGDASIRSLVTTSSTVGYDETFTVTLEVDTNEPISQAVRLELVLRDADGTAVAFDSSSDAREFVATSGDEPHQWVVTLPSSGADGIWTLTAAVYDFESSKFSDYQAFPIAIPDVLSAAPVIGGISPNEGYAEAAIVITGTNFMPDNTTCSVGGVPLQNQFVLNGNTITGNISDTLSIESHDVVCTTIYGTDTVTDGFTLLNTPPIAVNDNAGEMTENSSTVINVLSNDYDSNDDTLSVGTIGSTLDGAATVSGTTQIVFTPTVDFVGTTVFTYTVFDGTDYSNSATVILTVTAGPAEAPVAEDDSVLIRRDDAGELTNMESMISGRPITISVLLNDSDPEATDPNDNNLTILSVGAGSQGGTTGVTQTGLTVEYTPTANFTGSEQFTYTVGNGTGLTHTATVTATVVNGDGGITDDSMDGETVVTIPDAGISETVTITLTLPNDDENETLTIIYNDLDEPSEPIAENDAGLLHFTLDTYINNILQPTHVFSRPITVTIEYSDLDIENLPSGENSLEVWRWDGTEWSKDGIVTVVINPETNQITIEIDRPGEYAILANPNVLYFPIVALQNRQIQCIDSISLGLDEPIESRPASEVGEEFSSSTIEMAEINETCSVYISSNSTQVNSVYVDDVLQIVVAEQVVFEHDFATTGQIIDTVLQLTPEQINQISGQTVTVILKDRYGQGVNSSPIYFVIR